MHLAAQLLKSTSKSVAEVAGDVGYESEPSFNRAFKRALGVPPARFRSFVKSRREQSPDAVVADDGRPGREPDKRSKDTGDVLVSGRV
jgi:hypothetical protein